jgi:microcystin-dependent protein
MRRERFTQRPDVAHFDGTPAVQPRLPRRRFLAKLVAGLGGAALLGRARPASAATTASDPFVGELMLFAGNFAPSGWFLCDGSILPIASYDVLFALIGTTYGGDGATTFALPDLRGRVPIHQGAGPGLSNYYIGQLGGAERVTLLQANLPAHTHAASCMATAGSSDTPTGLLPARDGAGTLAWGATAAVAMAAGHIGSTGSSLSHENRMPVLALNWCIAWTGIFPSRA